MRERINPVFVLVFSAALVWVLIVGGVVGALCLLEKNESVATCKPVKAQRVVRSAQWMEI